ncbi:MAG: nickel pincer cofactor biosynthesis protein LarB [Ruminococcaceae bacterium]|nr:nickel pincer cofactor biosynthesis protein LarB [Oscillospiraceae bacterium]
MSSSDEKLKNIISCIRDGSLSPDDAFTQLRSLEPSSALDQLQAEVCEDLGFARVDHSRAARNGFAEVIFCEGKTPEQCALIAASLMRRSSALLATRANPEHYLAIKETVPNAVFHETARIITAADKAPLPAGKVAVVSAGTADHPVAEEAAVTAETLGCQVNRFSDVGVAGIHRLLSVIDQIRAADVIIAVAGMEGALVSVLGGLVDKPVFAVPSGIGYGANYGGITTLLAMLNSCASGVSVLNIGNGFGAGFMAATIGRQLELARGNRDD